jgi:hypothetical protein
MWFSPNCFLQVNRHRDRRVANPQGTSCRSHPGVVKVAIDEWKEASGVTEGALFRSINKTSRYRRNSAKLN